jgi:hypothetical protein
MYVETEVQIDKECNILWSSGGVHPFSEGLSGLRIQVQHVAKNSYFVEMILLLVAWSYMY